MMRQPLACRGIQRVQRLVALATMCAASACAAPEPDPEERIVSDDGIAVLATNGLPSNGLPTNGLPTNGLPTNGLPSNGLPSNGLPSNGLPIDGLSSSSQFNDWF